MLMEVSPLLYVSPFKGFGPSERAEYYITSTRPVCIRVSIITLFGKMVFFESCIGFFFS